RIAANLHQGPRMAHLAILMRAMAPRHAPKRYAAAALLRAHGACDYPSPPCPLTQAFLPRDGALVLYSWRALASQNQYSLPRLNGEITHHAVAHNLFYAARA